jgi:hypothetical protein
LRKTRGPSVAELNVGVRWRSPPIVSRAARTSSSETVSGTAANVGQPAGRKRDLSRKRFRKPRDVDGDHVKVYSGPEPPSGGVSRPPFAVIAPHWTQFDAVTSTVVSPPSSATS